MKHLGDITKISGYDVPIVDIITGGSPCQDLSVAGKREGLQGERSGLFMEQIRITKEMRDASDRRTNDNIRLPRKPRFLVWENVPGCLSSGTPKGEDFRIVLEEIAKIADENTHVPRLEGGARWAQCGCIMGDGYSIAWRIHDAQYWGVAQRRRRICVLADFEGHSAPKILFELRGETIDGSQSETVGSVGGQSRSEIQSFAKSVSRDSETSGETGKGTSSCSEGSTDKAISFQERAGCEGGGKGILIQNERVGTLSTLTNQSVFRTN